MVVVYKTEAGKGINVCSDKLKVSQILHLNILDRRIGRMQKKHTPKQGVDSYAEDKNVAES